MKTVKKIKLDDSILKQEPENLDADRGIIKSEEDERDTEKVHTKISKREKKQDLVHEKPKLHKVSRKKLRSISIKLNQETDIYLQEYKLQNIFSILNKKDKTNDTEKESRKCLAHMHPTMKPVWTSPCNVMKAINECLLTRNWNNLTYLLLELVHFTGEIYKPIIRNVYNIMDKLHPVIYENDMQGEFKKIRKYHQRILDNTTVV